MYPTLNNISLVYIYVSGFIAKCGLIFQEGAGALHHRDLWRFLVLIAPTDVVRGSLALLHIMFIN